MRRWEVGSCGLVSLQTRYCRDMQSRLPHHAPPWPASTSAALGEAGLEEPFRSSTGAGAGPLQVPSHADWRLLPRLTSAVPFLPLDCQLSTVARDAALPITPPRLPCLPLREFLRNDHAAELPPQTAIHPPASFRFAHAALTAHGPSQRHWQDWTALIRRTVPLKLSPSPLRCALPLPARPRPDPDPIPLVPAHHCLPAPPGPGR